MQLHTEMRKLIIKVLFTAVPKYAIECIVCKLQRSQDLMPNTEISRQEPLLYVFSELWNKAFLVVRLSTSVKPSVPK